MVYNLLKAWWKWSRLTQVLSREGSDAWTSVQIYLAVVQSVLLYGSETWVVTPCIGRLLGRFHHRVAHNLTYRQNWRGREGVWI